MNGPFFSFQEENKFAVFHHSAFKVLSAVLNYLKKNNFILKFKNPLPKLQNNFSKNIGKMKYHFN